MHLIWFALVFALGVAQFFAFLDGADELLDIGGFLAFIAFFIGNAVPLIGQAFVAYVAYIGATEVWDWEWWQAVLLIFPFLVLMVVLFAGDVLSKLFQRQ